MSKTEATACKVTVGCTIVTSLNDVGIVTYVDGDAIIFTRFGENFGAADSWNDDQFQIVAQPAETIKVLEKLLDRLRAAV